jgi:hypothetical protein
MKIDPLEAPGTKEKAPRRTVTRIDPLAVPGTTYQDRDRQAEQEMERREQLYQTIATMAEDPLAEKAKLDSSFMLSQSLGLPPETIYKDWNFYSKEWIGQETAPYSFAQTLKNQWDIATQTVQLGKAAYRWREGDESAKKEMDEIVANLPETDEYYQSLPQKALKSAMNIGPSLLDGYMAAGKAALVGAGTGLLYGAVTGTAAIPAAVGMAQIGSVLGAVRNTRQVEGGLAYWEYLQLKDPLGNPIDPELAATMSRWHEAFAAPIEVLQLKDVPGIGNIINKAMRYTGKELIQGMAARTLTEIGKDYGFGVVKEGYEEVLQDLSRKMFEAVLKNANNELKGTEFTQDEVKETLSGFWDTFEETVMGMAVLGIATEAVSVAMPGGEKDALPEDSVQITPGEEPEKETKKEPKKPTPKAEVYAETSWDTDTNSEIKTVTYRMMNTATASPLGRIDYTMSPDGDIEIRKIDAITDKQKDKMLEMLVRDNPDTDIVFKQDQSAKAVPLPVQDRNTFKAKLMEALPYYTEEEVEESLNLADKWAAKMKMSTDEWIRTYFTADAFKIGAKLGAARKASVRFLDDGRAVIKMTRASDISSFLHETMHIIRRQLTPKELNTVASALGVKDRFQSIASEEKFVEAFENYLIKGEIANPELKTAFQKIKEWLSGLYGIVRSPLMRDNITKVFDSIFEPGEEPEYGDVITPKPDEERAAREDAAENEPTDSDVDFMINALTEKSETPLSDAYKEAYTKERQREAMGKLSKLAGRKRILGEAETLKKDTTKNQDHMNTAMDYISTITERKFWTDNRSKSAENLHSQLIRGILKPEGNESKKLAKMGRDGKIQLSEVGTEPNDDGLYQTSWENSPEYGKYEYELSQSTSYSQLTDSQKEFIKDYLAENPQIQKNFDKFGETNYGKMLTQSALVGAALKKVLAGESVDSVIAGISDLTPTGEEAYRKALGFAADAGIDGVYEFVCTTGTGIIGRAKKPGAAVNGLMESCNPSPDCAKYCYGTKGHYPNQAVSLKQNMVGALVEDDPVRVAKYVADSYRALYPTSWRGRPLRMLDRGDLTQSWTKMIAALNDEGIATHIFSKNPEVLKQIDPLKNVTLMSIDRSNLDEARANPWAKLALVYAGEADLHILEEFKDQIQVILPVRSGKKLISGVHKETLLNKVEELGLMAKTCPVDIGEKTMFPGICATCAVGQGRGCYNQNMPSAKEIKFDDIKSKLYTFLRGADEEQKREIRRILEESRGEVPGEGRTAPLQSGIPFAEIADAEEDADPHSQPDVNQELYQTDTFSQVQQSEDFYDDLKEVARSFDTWEDFNPTSPKTL